MEIVFISVSILVITFLVWLVNKALPFKVCPICAGVSATWLLILVGILVGWLLLADYQMLVAMMMGGTVVGIAYQGEKRLSIAPKNFLKFRTGVIVPGLILAYLAATNISWLTLFLDVVVLAAVTYLYFIHPYLSVRKTRSAEDDRKVAELEEKMKECC